MTYEDSYAEIAPFYDLEFDSFDEDIELYLGYAQLVGGPILELGCGTGRLLTPLARAGFEITGLDNSHSMLELARRRAESERLESQITLCHGDMRDLSQFDGRSFRLVLTAINSFLHMENRDDQLTALGQIRHLLDRDGLLVLDIFNPTPETLVRMSDRYSFDAAWNLESGQRVERFSHRQLDATMQTIMTRLFYDVVELDGTVKRVSTSYTMRYIHRFELELLMIQAGFEIEGVYGSYSLDPLEPDSDHIILVAHRTPNPGEE